METIVDAIIDDNNYKFLTKHSNTLRWNLSDDFNRTKKHTFVFS